MDQEIDYNLNKDNGDSCGDSCDKISKINDIIFMLEEEKEKFDDMVDFLWNKVILTNTLYVLQNITEYDKNVFYKFMITNSSAIKNIDNLLDFYKKKALDISISK